MLLERENWDRSVATGNNLARVPFSYFCMTYDFLAWPVASHLVRNFPKDTPSVT